MKFSCLSAVRGRGEHRTEPYGWYGEGVAELLTKKCAKRESFIRFSGRVFTLLLLIQVAAGCAASESNVFGIPEEEDVEARIAYLHDGDLWLYDQEQARSKHVLSSDEREIHDPTFLPNGSGVLYAKKTEKYDELWLYDIDRGTITFLVAEPAPLHTITPSPNSQFALFFIEQDLYLFDLQTNLQVRIHEGAKSAAWSDDSRKFIYTTDDQRLIVRELSVNEQLQDGEIIFTEEEGTVEHTVFLDTHTIAFETLDNGEEDTILRYDLISGERQSLTSLRFPHSATESILRRSPDATQILYGRPEENEESVTFSVWVINVEKDAPKLILENVAMPFWSDDGNALYYGAKDENNIMNLYRSTSRGLNKTLLVRGVESMTTTASSL